MWLPAASYTLSVSYAFGVRVHLLADSDELVRTLDFFLDQSPSVTCWSPLLLSMFRVSGSGQSATRWSCDPHRKQDRRRLSVPPSMTKAVWVVSSSVVDVLAAADVSLAVFLLAAASFLSFQKANIEYAAV